MDSGSLKFYISAYTAKGFVSFSDQIKSIAEYTYNLSGAPGPGAEALMKIISEGLGRCVIFPDQIIPGETDGVFLPEKNIFISKPGNPPAEPSYTFVREESVNLEVCFDRKEILKKKKEIISLTELQAEAKKRAVRYLSAAAALLTENRKLVRRVCNIEKIKAFAKRLAAGTLEKSSRGSGREQRVFLSCVNCAGPVYINETLRTCGENIYVIEDEYGAVSRPVLEIIRKRALELGFDIYTAMCGLHGSDKLEHILIPEAGTAFCTSNRYHNIREYTSRQHIRRFIDRRELEKSRGRLNYNKQAAAELISGASFLFGEVFAYHQQLRSIYTDAFDEDIFWDIALKLAENLGLFSN